MMRVLVQIVSTVKGQNLSLLRWSPQDLGIICETPCIGPPSVKKRRGTFCGTLFCIQPIFALL